MILVNVWYGAPFFLIMYLAALKSVPEQLYEAAAIDGANAWQKFVHITLPMMRNIIAITVLFSLIVTFANFDIVQIMTAGGPRNMTHVFATYAFLLGIRSGDIPLGASVSLFMFPILAIVGGLHPARRAQAREGDRMTAAAVAEPAPRRRAGSRASARNRRWALIASYVFLDPVRDLLPGAALLHDRDVAQERRRGRPHGDQSVDHRQRRHPRPVRLLFTQIRLPDLLQEHRDRDGVRGRASPWW